MVRKIGIVLVLAWILSVGTEQCSVPTGLLGVAFAQLQEDGQPCPPECVTDTLEIMTWYPSPWNSYEELYTMKLGVGDVTTGDGESHLRPKTVGSIKVERSVVFKPMAEDPVPEKDLYTGEYTNVETGEMIYNSGEDKFKYFNGQAWVPQTGGSSSLPVLYTACSWRYDYREGAVGIGAASNWGCTPPACPTTGGTWVDLGVTATEPLAVACSGTGGAWCTWDDPRNYYHPVSAGRSVRACLRQ